MPASKQLKIAIRALLEKEGPLTFNNICRRVSGSRKLIFDALDELRGLKITVFDESFQNDHEPGRWKLASGGENQSSKKDKMPIRTGTGRTEFEKYL